MSLPAAPHSEAFSRRWSRRAVTIPAVHVALFVTATLALPLGLIFGVLDVVTGPRGVPRFVRLRFLGFVLWYLVHELGGLWAAASFQVVGRGRDTALHFRLQHAWERAQLRGLRWIYGLRFTGDAESAAVPSDARVIVFARHASVADSLLPGHLFGPDSPLMFDGPRRSLNLRWVLKRELLVVPCLDVVGHRIPTVFVHRRGRDTSGDAEAIAALGQALVPGEGVILFPEGTRFSPEKREAAPGEHRYVHLLPPRHAGPMSLLDAATRSGLPHEVLILGHTGFERVHRFADLWRGALVGLEVRCVLRRISLRDLPDDAVGRRAWLDAEWAHLDAWLSRVSDHPERAP